MYRSPRSRTAPALILVAALLLPTLATSACASSPSRSAQLEQNAQEPPKKRKRFYDPWGQPYEENTPDDSPPQVEYEESDAL